MHGRSQKIPDTSASISGIQSREALLWANLREDT